MRWLEQDSSVSPGRPSPRARPVGHRVLGRTGTAFRRHAGRGQTFPQLAAGRPVRSPPPSPARTPAADADHGHREVAATSPNLSRSRAVARGQPDTRTPCRSPRSGASPLCPALRVWLSRASSSAIRSLGLRQRSLRFGQLRAARPPARPGSHPQLAAAPGVPGLTLLPTPDHTAPRSRIIAVSAWHRQSNAAIEWT